MSFVKRCSLPGRCHEQVSLLISVFTPRIFHSPLGHIALLEKHYCRSGKENSLNFKENLMEKNSIPLNFALILFPVQDENGPDSWNSMRLKKY